MIEQTEKLKKIHSEAMIEFNAIQDAVADDRRQCLEDRRFCFISGAQWDGWIGEQFENKPRFELNKIHLAVIRIINEFRNNSLTVDFLGKNASGDKNATFANNLYRAVEQDSVASEAYDTAFEEAVMGGIGAFRMRACYEDENDPENDEQTIVIEPITDACSNVFFDLGAKRKDKSDAKRCYVLVPMTRADYEAEFDDDPVSWPKEIQSDTDFSWVNDDSVFVAEHYVTEYKPMKVYKYKGIDGKEESYTEEDFENDETLESTLSAVGTQLVSERTIKTKKIHKYILSGGGVLEDCGIIAGSEIPIIPVYGKRQVIDNIEHCMGHVRLAKDAQRLYNMLNSLLSEIAALSPREKPIFAPEQIDGFQTMWSDDNIENYPYLLAKPITGADGESMSTGPIGYTRVPNIPPAMAALISIVGIDMKEILGNGQDGEKIVSNISAKAIELVQQRLDVHTFIYVSNFQDALVRGGHIFLSMAKDIYSKPERKVKIRNKANKNEIVELMRPNVDEKGIKYTENDISDSSFDVAVTVGPKSDSQRAATVRALSTMAATTQDPEMAMILNALTLMNIQGDGLEDVHEYLRKKMVRMGVLTPTDDDKEEMKAEAEGRTDPNAQYLAAAAEEATANAAQARAQTIKTIADAEKAKADTKLKEAQTVETIAGIEREDIALAESLLNQNTNQINQGL